MRNSTGIVSATTYTTQNFTINWSNLPGDDYTYNITVYDIADNQVSVIRKITLIETEFNVTLKKGWNMIGLNMEATEANTDRNVTIATGSNLISHSSDTPLSVGNLLFTNLSGNTSTWLEAVTANKVQGYLAYISNTSTKTNRDWDYAAPSYMPVSDDTQLREGIGYWLRANENGTLTMPGVGGTINGTTYNWADLWFRHSNGTDLNITDASSAGWVLPADDSDRAFINYDDGGFKYVCSSVGRTAPHANCKSTTLSSWKGYYIWSNYDNITILRQN